MTSGLYNRFRTCSLWLLICWLGLSSTYAGQTGVAEEYDLKAAMLSRFVSFVEWPEEAFDAPDAPYVIGVYGSNPFGPALEESVGGQIVGDWQFQVRPWGPGMEDAALHLLFVPRGEVLPASERNRLGNNPVLIVTETENSASRGIINLVLEDNRVRFQISRRAANQSGLRLSSQLLGLATIIDE